MAFEHFGIVVWQDYVRDLSYAVHGLITLKQVMAVSDRNVLFDIALQKDHIPGEHRATCSGFDSHGL